jgi:hypothetical protein
LKCRNFYDIEFSQKSTTRLCFSETKDSSDKIASTEEPISKESLPERMDESEHASSVSTVTSKENAPPYPDISSRQDSKLQMTDVKMQLLTANCSLLIVHMSSTDVVH